MARERAKRHEAMEVVCLECWKKESKPFKVDYRQSNPGLHMLYVKTAVDHLALIDRQMAELSGRANGNLLDMVEAMEKQREKLVTENAAYFDAAHILEILRGTANPSGMKVGRDEEEDENPAWGLSSR
jgi:hypothetical protein